MNEEEIKTQRKSWELEDHWQLRNAFMSTYCDTFPPDKLLCLAQTFVNVETLGVKYSPDVMEEIERLAENVPNLAEYRATKERRDEESAERKRTRKQEKKNFKVPRYDRNNQRDYYPQNCWSRR